MKIFAIVETITVRPNLENGISWEVRNGVYNETIGLISLAVHQELNIFAGNLTTDND